MLFNLIRKYKSLTLNNKKILWGLLFIVFGYFIFLKIFPNKNKWTFVDAFGIKVPLRYELHGIDVSHHNGKIDWAKVKDVNENDVKISFAFIKASEGTSITDKDFKKNWAEAKENGIKRGAYHYFIPWRDPESQVALFKKNVSLTSGDFPPILDIEENALRSDNKIIKDIGTWLILIENHYGIKPIIYTNQSYFNKFIKGNYENYPLWIADYTKKNLDLYDGEKLHFWQYSKKGKLDGIKGDVDFNSYLHSENDFENLLK
jgi:lysozyme